MSAARPAAGRGTAHDLRLVPPALAVWLVSFALIVTGPTVSYGVAAGCGALAAGALLWPGHAWPGPHRRAVAVAVLACAAAGAAGVGLRLTAVGSGPVRALANADARASMEVVITADPQSRPVRGRELLTVRARAETVWTGPHRPVDVRVPVLLIVRGPVAAAWRDLVPSQRVRLEARLARPDRAELLAAIALVRGPPSVIDRPSTAQRAAATVRAKLREASDDLPATQRAVLPGMVVGDTSRLDPDLAEDFEDAGLTHIMVVSGANLALIISGVLALAGLVRLGRRRGALLAALAVSAFVVVARPEPSVLRATVMGFIGLLALVSGRERRGVPALAAAVLVLVLADPELARSYGFALSVLATAGLLVLAPPWRERLSGRMPRPVAEVVAVAAAAQLACAPVLVMLTGELSLVAIGANLLAAPAIAPATLLGALAATVAPVAMPVARLLVRPAGLAVGWIVTVARLAAGVPYGTVRWRDGALGAASLIAVAALAAFVLRHPPARRIAAAACAGLLVVAVAVRIVAPGWPPRGWLFVACDVGQGDALVLTAGPGRAVVVDAGPASAAVDRCLRDLGVREVPLLVLTHPHADHVDGVPGAMRGRAGGTVLPSPLSEGEERGLVGGRAVREARPGQVWTIGALSLSVLGPVSAGPRISTHDPGTEVNNASVVLVARVGGLGVLLTGDVETEAQRTLAPGVPPVHVLKVPHHGSARQAREFLAASRARIAVISVGAGNTYGHPAPATLAMLRGLGMHDYRTDLHGDIAVLNHEGRPAVVARRS
ncbi:ComEC/Rec2 family competence protein [Actinomadura alba]|uniref:ComEC/Rec2 family competence protein n=1 Tax=Actinomadura alba TaxID=406431 RepID=A0ABR7LGV4_9ACTN|nr:ComEC/Rec2 family competence protein [Actinomadura alba]MBC6464006.1 ComEC/Rec2 family competence protein [Actinomadura alba]